MSKIELKQYVWNIVLLIIALILILIGQFKWALFLIIAGIFGIFFKTYIIKKKIEPYSKKVSMLSTLFLFFFMVFGWILFNREVNLLRIITLMFFVILFYFSTRFSNSRYTKPMTLNEKLYVVILLLIMLPMIPLYVITIGKIILSQTIPLWLITIDIFLLVILIFSIYFIKKKKGLVKSPSLKK